MEGLLEVLDSVIIDPTKEDFRNIYKLMTGVIVPRPIAFVSTVSADGIGNLAPFSFFTAVSANPPVICFSPLIRGSDGAKKDTLKNIESTGEFVVHIVSEDIAERMNACSPEFPPDVDEFAVSGLTPIAADLVRPARVAEAKIAMECRLLQIVPVSQKPLGANLVLGTVLRFHIQDVLFDNFRIDPEKLEAIARMGGPTYSRTRDRFNLERPSSDRAMQSPPDRQQKQ